MLVGHIRESEVLEALKKDMLTFGEAVALVRPKKAVRDTRKWGRR